MSATAQSCSHCQKSSLSLLLLRPSPIATHSDLQPPGAALTRPDNALVTPLIPPGLTHSRPVLRLLRAGYVHLYIPKTAQWRTWRVTDQADLLAPDHPLFATPSVSAVCSRTGHNDSGFKLLSIPQAHDLMGHSIWLAFSANLWSDAIKGRNKANPQAMVEIKLGSVAAPAFKPDAQRLKTHVLECNVSSWRLPNVDPTLQPAFAFSSLATDSQVQHMAKTLTAAASRHPKTAGQELAVVLPDPVGYAAELNALRLIAEKGGLQLSPQDQHKLQSHFELEGLANNVADMRAVNNVAPVMSLGSFEAWQKSSPKSAQGASWKPVQANDCPGPRKMGRMWTPKAREDLQQQAPAFMARAKKEIEGGYEPAKSLAWVKELEEKTRKALEPYEKQWLAGRDHAAVAQYFVQHFDEEDRNRPGTAQAHSPGAAYVQEVSWIDGPTPTTSAALVDAYVAAYFKRPDDPSAFVVRAMAANQSELFAPLLKQLSGDPNGEEATGGMRDKSVDFIKGLLDVKGEHFRVKYSWLTDATMVFATGPMNNLAAAAGNLLALEGVNALAKRPKVAALAMNAAAWFGGANTALKSAMTQKVVRPVVASFWVESDVVNRAIRGPRGEFHGRGKQLVTVLTDTERLSKGSLDVNSLINGAGSDKVARGKKAGVALAAQASDAIVLNAATGLTPQMGAALFTQQVEEARKIGGTIRAAIPQGAKAVTMSIDGRLALASVIVQTMGVINGRKAVDQAQADLAQATDADRAAKEKALSDARLGYMDSVGGLVAGSLDSLRVAGEAMNLQRGAAAGTVALTSIHALKFGAQMTGVFGGFLNGYVSYLKYEDAKDKGWDASARAHWLSSRAFYGTGLTSLVAASLVGAEYLVAEKIGSKAVQQVAGRFVAARVGGMAVGAMVPVAGWVLLGVGIVGTVGAAVLEPTKLEAWARKTPFGSGPGGQKFKTLEEQNKALNEALGIASQSEPTQAKAA